MKWTYKTQEEIDAEIRQWHNWFAWHPVWQDGKAAWFCTVKRKAEVSYMISRWVSWEYDL